MAARHRLKTLCLAALCAAPIALALFDQLSVSSPNGQIEFRLFLTQQPDPSEPLLRLAYQVFFKGKQLMDTSFMGLNIRDQPILGVNVGLDDVEKSHGG